MLPLCRVLIVDDDKDIRDVLEEFLSGRNILIETASNGAEALKRSSEVNFDVVITDIKMPSMDGITLMRELLKLHPDISIMVMTSFSDEYPEKDALSVGARDFISKPFNLTEFAIRFQKLVRDHQEFQMLRKRAHIDLLTGLPNRQMFYDRVTEAIEYSRRYKHSFSLLYIDIDNLKPVNDEKGHYMGDLLLKEAGARLRGCVRKSDTVARFGGDEFIILLSHISAMEEISHFAARIVESIAEPFTLDGSEVNVGSSVGISIYPSDGEDVEDLIRKADSAMYRVKKRGKNGYEFFCKPSSSTPQ
ncbi:MAG: GGDEF domain-containing response regulator [Nitrospirae bacterium]|nr:GGDEF domain-containing response regulator [Nitrospirota bacterium]